MSEDQIEHAENIEHLVPSFEALRVGLQNNLGDERFWMIYFILLLPRLNEHDFEVLSSPEVRDLIYLYCFVQLYLFSVYLPFCHKTHTSGMGDVGLI